MNNFIKYAMVGIGGYLVGFYEMKYKTTKALLEVLSEKTKEEA